ncbi:N-acetylglucosamine-6-phosphate deacetylase [Rhizocola hellebori]|uniref:N-acetylglucosamine-6-phosphate deacetylase n=1 Tax=Rhizocola hellebori TaxID=1392758 RepID=A0A8J3VGV5_9ACTN|nr:N-acetylglucosamine-6-phosphate deacetylase [Rhizocola hellebori]GIH05577.1 N-acetylglucosamine-6-phosphate deacetylase [Rhizocola hellebori]
MNVIAGTLVLPDAVTEGWVQVSDGLITQVGTGAAPQPPTLVTDGYVMPGLVDMHCHGGGGSSFDRGAEAAEAVARFHLAHGTTSIMASLSTTTRERLLSQVKALAPIVGQSTLVGMHLEGPFLSELRCGAHPPHLLRDPDWEEIAEVLAAGEGAVRMLTIAPELPYALEVVDWLTREQVIVAIGHTDATFAETQAAIGAGATVATHLFNGMRPIHHREGGPVTALLGDERVWCELICDGHHLSPEVCRLAFRAAGNHRAVLITDACTAAGMPDGPYVLGGESIVLAHGAVHTADGRSLAGSALTLLAAVRFAVSCGIPLPDAVRAASANPADALGLPDRGRLAPGLRADLLLTDRTLHPTQVMRGGILQ